jgi:hypothetical protein
MPFPVAPSVIWYVAEESASFGHALTWRLIFKVVEYGCFTRRFIFCLTVTAAFEVTIFNFRGSSTFHGC